MGLPQRLPATAAKTHTSSAPAAANTPPPRPPHPPVFHAPCAWTRVRAQHPHPHKVCVPLGTALLLDDLQLGSDMPHLPGECVCVGVGGVGWGGVGGEGEGDNSLRHIESL